LGFLLAGTQLVLDPKTELGGEFAQFRKYLQDIPIDCITFGTLANRHFCAEDIKLPKFMVNKFTKEFICKKNEFLTFHKFGK